MQVLSRILGLSNFTSFKFSPPQSAHEANDAMQRFIQSIEEVLPLAENFGIKLLVENNVCIEKHRGVLLLQTTDEFLSLFDSIKSMSLGILLDTGHLNVTAYTYNFNPMEFIYELTSKIKAIHLHDNDGIIDSHLPVRKNRWMLDTLHLPQFAETPIIVEAKFNSVVELHSHIDWLKGNLNST